MKVGEVGVSGSKLERGCWWLPSNVSSEVLDAFGHARALIPEEIKKTQFYHLEYKRFFKTPAKNCFSFSAYTFKVEESLYCWIYML